MTTRIKPTKAGWRLLWGAAGFTLLVALLTARWALDYVDKGVQRMKVSVFILLLLVVMCAVYVLGWLVFASEGHSGSRDLEMISARSNNWVQETPSCAFCLFLGQCPDAPDPERYVQHL